MRVLFSKKYFGPNGQRFRPGLWYTVPDSWADRLPSGTKVDDSVLDEPVIEEKKKGRPLREKREASPPVVEEPSSIDL